MLSVSKHKSPIRGPWPMLCNRSLDLPMTICRLVTQIISSGRGIFIRIPLSIQSSCLTDWLTQEPHAHTRESPTFFPFMAQNCVLLVLPRLNREFTPNSSDRSALTPLSPFADDERPNSHKPRVTNLQVCLWLIILTILEAILGFQMKKMSSKFIGYCVLVIVLHSGNVRQKHCNKNCITAITRFRAPPRRARLVFVFVGVTAA